MRRVFSFWRRLPPLSLRGLFASEDDCLLLPVASLCVGRSRDRGAHSRSTSVQPGSRDGPPFGLLVCWLWVTLAMPLRDMPWLTLLATLLVVALFSFLPFWVLCSIMNSDTPAVRPGQFRFLPFFCLPLLSFVLLRQPRSKWITVLFLCC